MNPYLIILFIFLFKCTFSLINQAIFSFWAFIHVFTLIAILQYDRLTIIAYDEIKLLLKWQYLLQGKPLVLKLKKVWPNDNK